MEKLITGIMIDDMKEKLDPSQYGNEKGTSVEHYLVKMIHRIITVLDNNKKEKLLQLWQV